MSDKNNRTAIRAFEINAVLVAIGAVSSILHWRIPAIIAYGLAVLLMLALQIYLRRNSKQEKPSE